MRAGSYSAARASALSGVPWSTVHEWARKGVVVPSVSPERVKLWAYGDLLALRTIYWLRHAKRTVDGREVKGTPMSTIKKAIARLRVLDADMFENGRPTVAVTPKGEILLKPVGQPMQWLEGQLVLTDALDLIAPFDSAEGGRGPDLVTPSKWVRILPRRLSGALHVKDTRIESEGLYALTKRGFDTERIASLYPELSVEAVQDAIDLEQGLDVGARAA
jgi:uncharacterized protein (DUF433 family)